MPPNVRIVLVQTWHPGNIGAAARAMKNMGLSELTLVNPVDFPSDEAISRAGKATDLLANAKLVSTLAEAIEDCTWVVATSARERHIKLPALTAEACAQKVMERQQHGTVALVFGRERMGLHNDDIQQCHAQVNIAAHPDYPVLNLSQAVQLMAYEIFKATQQPVVVEKAAAYPTQSEIIELHRHLEDRLTAIGFLNKKRPGQPLEHLKALLRRAEPTQKELRLLRGILSASENRNP